MLQLIWGVLNIGLIISFLLISFRLVRLVKEKIGLLAAIVVVLGLLSFTSISKNESHKEGEWISISEAIDDCNDVFTVNVELEKNMVLSQQLIINTGSKNLTKVNVPLSASTLTNGFTSGRNWEVSSVAINPSNDPNMIHYAVTEIVDWNLLWLTIYKERKEFKGTVSIEK